ncbi:MAG TPA: hypothetical protein VG737_03615 [Cyclobacteriaceae bacterium]|nr:hypothetical protein [Cyclobacteriaceae bacterium]
MAFAIVIALLNSCATRRPTTNITGSWKEPAGKAYQNFLVAVLAKNLPARSSIEGDMVRDLKREKVKASKSLDILGHDEKLDTPEQKRAAVDKIKTMDYDAIIVVTLLKKTEESRYVPGTTSYTPANIGVGTGYYNPVTNESTSGGSYGPFGIYYMDASSAYNTPGYYEKDQIYFVQSNMYDARTEKLVWSAQSDTFYSGDLATASNDFAHVMVQDLKNSNLIFRKEK